MKLNPIVPHRVRIGLLLLALIVFVGQANRLSYAQGQNRAGLVVNFGNGNIQTRCVTFTGDSLTGAELLQRAGYSIITGFGGGTLCSLNGVGCPSSNCWCQCSGSPCIYWNYYLLKDGAWRYSQVGFSQRRLQAGDVDGWEWGATGVHHLPNISFAEICPQTQTDAATATATITPLPTATNTPVPTATHTPEPTPTNTAVPSPTSTPLPPTNTATATPLPPPPTHTLTPTPTPAPSATFTAVPTATPPPTATTAPSATPTLTASLTPTPGRSPTASPTLTRSPSPTGSRTSTATATPTVSPTRSPTPSPTVNTPTPTVTPLLPGTPRPTPAPTPAPPSPTLPVAALAVMGVGALLIATGLIVLAFWLRQREAGGDEGVHDE